MMSGNELLKEEALLKMADLCARSEQSAYNIERKLRLKGFDAEDVALIITELRARKFIDDSRFARSFANDKLRFAGWGRVKIRAALALHHIGSDDISAALESLDEEAYDEMLVKAARAKARRLNPDDYADRVKLMRHLASKGFTRSEASRAIKLIREAEDD